MAINPLLIGGGVVGAAAIIGGGLYAGGVFNGSSNAGISSSNSSTGEAGNNLVGSVTIEAANEKTSYGSGFGSSYSRYLLSTKSNRNNEEWKKKADSLKTATTLESGSFFTSITAETEENAKITKLKNVCEEKYKVAESDSEKDKWNEVWKYCSLFSEKPKTIKGITSGVATSYDTSHHGKVGENQLMSVNGNDNQDFWNLQQTKYGNKGNQTVKEWCYDAYGKANTESGYEDTEVYKYCSLEGTKKTTTPAG